MNTKDKITKILQENLSPKKLIVIDESAQHAGHAGAKKSGGGHFIVKITSERFEGLDRLERHRLVHEILKPLGPEIHALALKTLSPNEH